MATTTFPGDLQRETLNDIGSLRTASTQSLMLATLAGSAVWLSALALRVPYDVMRMWILPAGLAIASLTGLWLWSGHPRLGRNLFLALVVAALVVNLRFDGDLQSAYYLALTVLACSSMLELRGTLLVAVVVSLCVVGVAHVWGLSPLPQTYVRAITMVWLVFGLSWLSTRNLYIAAEWANQSQAAAQERLQDLRSRRAELRRLSDMLRINQERLHYLNVRLEQAKVAAEEAYRTKQHFVANVSHELRTPLNLITGFAEMMAFTPESYGGVLLPDSYRQDVLEIYRSSKHLVGLIEDVLALAQLEAGQMLIKRDWADLNKLLHEVADTMRPLILAKNLALCVEEVDLPPVSCDAGRIRQIVLNLLNNAYRYTEQGSISLGGRQADGQVLISVTDTGVGISEQDLPYIFQDFHKLGQGTAARRSDGFGLGLSISRRLAEAHGGSLSVESRPGVGSTFTLALPVKNVPASANYPTLVQTDDSTHKTRQQPVVMVVSESADDRLGAHLEGFETVHAPLEECEDAYDQYQPSAVLLNAQPNGANPPDSFTRLLHRAPGLPVVTCRLPTRQDLARELQADAVLTKPISRADLLDTLRRLAEAQPVHSILIVDDEESMCRMLGRALASAVDAGYEVQQALGGPEALDILQQQLPDLILLDLGMPQISGYDILEWLRDHPAATNTRIVLTTGLSLEQDAALIYDVALHCAAGLPLTRALQVVTTLLQRSLSRVPAQN